MSSAAWFKKQNKNRSAVSSSSRTAPIALHFHGDFGVFNADVDEPFAATTEQFAAHSRILAVSPHVFWSNQFRDRVQCGSFGAEWYPHASIQRSRLIASGANRAVEPCRILPVKQTHRVLAQEHATLSRFFHIGPFPTTSTAHDKCPVNRHIFGRKIFAVSAAFAFSTWSR